MIVKKCKLLYADELCELTYRGRKRQEEIMMIILRPQLFKLLGRQLGFILF